MKTAEEYQVNINEYTFFEPSAGKGAFYNLLPVDKRVGIDINPKIEGVEKIDFFDWLPENKKYIVVGNPPFGFKGWLALAFLNRIAEFADLVGFILPMYFDSDGKGTPKRRVKGLNLLHSEELPPNIFENLGKSAKINTVWQVWGKFENKNKCQLKTCNEFVDVFMVSTHPLRKCGLGKVDRCNLFIPNSFYKSIEICKSFDDINYVFGYGVIIKKNVQQIEDYLFKNVDWFQYSSRATNNCRHIKKSDILKAVIDGGFVDEMQSL